MRKNGKITGKDDLYYSGIFGLTLLSDGRAVATRWIGMGLYDFREPGQDTFLGFPMGVNTTTSVSTAPGNPYVLVGNNSGILHVMPQDRLKGEMGHIPPLLSLCLAGTEWIAWTPEGYYAASPGGERLMGWQVNNGADQLANFYPAAQFRKTFYRPDVIKRLLATNSLEKALAQANQERGTSTPKITVAQALPPRVRLVRPEPTATKLTTPRLTVQAEATDPAHPIASLQLLLDGRPLQTRQIQPPRPGEITASWDIDVPAGRHRLAVKAVNDVSQALSDEVEVTYGPEGGATAAKGTLYVLAIGVNAYPGRLKLDAAVPDAQALTKAFRQHSRPLFQDVNVKLVLDQNATRRNILSELDALQREAKPGDVVVVFYAGHGDSKLTGELHLVPVDADLKNLAGTGVSGETLRAKLGNLPCTTLVILDACYSGSFSAGKKKGALPTGADKLVREFMYDDMLVVMCGAAKDQEAGEEQGHGYFTRALVEGLSGQAPKDEAGLIDLDALQLYVGRRVKKLSDGDQVPTIHRPSTVSNIPLARP
jgi:hypothetical protein